jgi:predicted Zn-ribbon and HTH transcriptional regulator
MNVQIQNRFKKFNPDAPDVLNLRVIWCKNCCAVFAVETWNRDTACPLCSDNAIKEYEMDGNEEYLDYDIRKGGRT